MEPYDKQMAEYLEKNDPTGRVILRGGQALPAEAVQYDDQPVSTYIETQGIPFTAEALGYKDSIKLDPAIEMKVHAIDEHIRMKMQEEGLRDSRIGYKTIFSRLTGGKNLNDSMTHAERTRILDNLFMQVSLENRMSSKTFLQHYTKRFAAQRIEKLTNLLKSELNKLKQ